MQYLKTLENPYSEQQMGFSCAHFGVSSNQLEVLLLSEQNNPEEVIESMREKLSQYESQVSEKYSLILDYLNDQLGGIKVAKEIPISDECNNFTIFGEVNDYALFAWMSNNGSTPECRFAAYDINNKFEKDFDFCYNLQSKQLGEREMAETEVGMNIESGLEKILK